MNLRMYPGPLQAARDEQVAVVPLDRRLAAGTEKTFFATPSLMVDTWPPNSSVT